MNESNKQVKKITFDKTSPIVESVVINNTVSDGSRKWLRKDSFSLDKKPSKVSVTVTAVETTAGIETIKITGAKLSESSKIYLGSDVSGTPLDCELDAANGTITFAYSENPELKGDGQFSFTITNIEFTDHLDDGKPNKINVLLTDFAGNEQADSASDEVYIDSKSDAKPKIIISDVATAITGGNNFWQWSDTKTSFTDSDAINIEVTLDGDADTETGVKSLVFSNVQFESTATVSPAGTFSGSVITFNDILSSSQTIIINGAKILEKNSDVTVGVTAVDLIGWNSDSGTDSILHDDKKPAFTESPVWLSVSGDIDGLTDKLNQKDANKKQKLKVPYSETGSGLKVIQIDGALTGDVSSVSDGSITLTKDTDYTINDNYIVFAEPLISDSGVIYIEGLVLDTAATGDTSHTVTVSLFDTAENDDGASSENKATICIDTTAPKLNKIVFPQIKHVLNYADLSELYFFAKDVLNTNAVTVELYVEEATSGIKVIDFTGGTIMPSADSVITMKASGKEPVEMKAGIDFTVSDRVITFNNDKFSIISDASEFTLEITNCKLGNIRAPADLSLTGINLISVKIADFAGLDSGTAKTKATYTKVTPETEYSEIIANMVPSAVPEIKLSDRGTDENRNNDLVLADDGYTNYKIVDGTVTITIDSENAAQKLSLSNGAKFITSGSDKTEFYVGSDLLEVGDYKDYTITESTVTFTKAFDNTVTLKIKNIELSDVAMDGEKSVSLKTTAPTEFESENGNGKITLDTTPPVLNENGPLSYSELAVEEYPKGSLSGTIGLDTTSFGNATADTNGDGKTIRYFYTSGADSVLGNKRVLFVQDKTAKIDKSPYKVKFAENQTAASSKAENIVSGAYNDIVNGVESDDSIEIASKEYESTLNPYSYVAVDAAGNVSKAYSFYVIKDNTGPFTKISDTVSFDSRFAYTEPAGAFTHRNPGVSSTKGYIIRKCVDDKKYKITVKLNSISTSDKLIDGNDAALNTDEYSEIRPTVSQSGLAAWAVTSDGAEPDPSAWKSYIAGGDIEFSPNDYIAENKKLTLHLKDNCGNTSKIDITDVDGNTVLWTIDDTPPSVTSFAASSKADESRTTLTEGTSGTGSQFGRAYVNSGITYFNSKAYLGITYEAETCLFETSAENTSNDNPLAQTDDTTYTVKARLYYTENASVELSDSDANTIINADSSVSANTFVSPWYYFKDSSGGRTFYVPYPNRGEGASGNLYLFMEDRVGNRSVTQVWNGDDAASGAKTFCYNNEPPVVNLAGVTEESADCSVNFAGFGTAKYFTHLNQSAYVSLINLVEIKKEKTIFVDETASPTVTTVYSGKHGAPSFKFTISKNPSGYKYKYFSSAAAFDPSTESEDFSKTWAVDSEFTSVIPVSESDLIIEKTAGAAENELYLYLQDNVGNISVTKIGSTKWMQDKNAPTVKDWSKSGHPNPGNSYITRNDDDGDIKIAIAAAGSGYAPDEPYTVYIPTSWFDDAGGAGVCGLSLDTDDIEDVSKIVPVTETYTGNVQCYPLVIPKDFHAGHDESNPVSASYYVYDKVGNYKEYAFTVYANDKGPELGAKFSVSSGHRIHTTDLRKGYDSSDDIASNELTSSAGYNNAGNNYAYTLKTSKQSDVSDTKTIWTTTETVMLELVAHDENGISSISVDKKIGAADWTTFKGPFTNTNSDYKKWNFDSTKTAADTSGDTKYNYEEGAVATNYIELTASAAGNVYRISAANFNGNPMYHYIKLILDDEEPEVSQVVTVNNGARINGDTYCYNNMSATFELTHSTADITGLGDIAYKITPSSIYVNTGIVDKKISKEFNSSSYNGSTINLYVQDFLGNETVYPFKEGGVEKFMFDNGTPEITSVVGKRDGTAAADGTGTLASGTLFTVTENTTTRTWNFNVRSAEKSTITFTPTWSDPSSSYNSSGIYKYIVKTEKSASVSDFASGNDNGETISYTASPFSDENPGIILDGTANTYYLYAIDYAGNISEPVTINIKYENVAPIYSSATFHNIHSATPNIYSPNIGYMALSYETKTGGALTGYCFYSDAKGAEPIGTKKTVSGVSSPLNIKLPEYKNETDTFGIWIRLYCDTGESQLARIGGNSVSWKMDKTAPEDAPVYADVKNSAGTKSLIYDGYYYDSGKLFFSASADTTAKLHFTVTSDTASLVTSTEQAKIGTFSSITTIANPVPVSGLLSNGDSTTFYAIDNAYNPSAGTTINYVLDNKKPTVSFTSVSVGNSAYLSEESVTGDNNYKYYFNAAKKNTTEYNVPSITFSVSSDDTAAGSGIASYTYEVSYEDSAKTTATKAKLVSVSGANTFTIPSDAGVIDYSKNMTVTITATDNVGNVSDEPVTITLVPDSGKPVIEVDSFTSGADDIVTKYPNYISTVNSNWKTETGGEVFFNSNRLTPKITFTASDGNSGVNPNASSELVTVTYTHSSGSHTGIATGDSGKGVVTTVTGTAFDKVGNEAEFIVTFKSDGNLPTIGTPVLTNSDGFIYQPSANKNTIYYNGGETRAGGLSFTVKDETGANNSGLKEDGKFFYSDTGTLTEVPDDATFTNSYSLNNTTLTGNHYFYTADKVGNVSKETGASNGYEITFVNDTAKPVISGVTVAGQSGSGYHRDGDNFYFNATDGHEKKATSITFTVTASDKKNADQPSAAGIKSYSYKVGTADPVVQAAATYTINTSGITGKTKVVVTVTDNVGNVSEESELYIIPDSGKPTATITPPSTKGAGYYISSGNFYFTADTTLFTGSASFSISSPSDGTDGSDIKEYYYKIGTSKIDASVTTFTPVLVSVPAATDNDKTISFYAIDNVGNESNALATYTLVYDNEKPDIPKIDKLQINSSTDIADDDNNIHGETGWKSTSGKTVFFNSKIYSSGIKVLFKSSDATSKLEGIYLSSATSPSNSYDVTDITNKTSLTVYAKDFVGNKSDNFTINVTPDSIEPTISSAVIDTTSDYVSQDASNAKKYYFNADSSKVSSLTLTVSAEDKNDTGLTPSGIKTYSYKVGTANVVTVTSSAATNTYTISTSGITVATDVVITVTDNVGNVSDVTTITLVPDGTAPKIEVGTFKDAPAGGTETTIEDANTNIHIVNGTGELWSASGASWRNTSGGTVWFNPNTGKITSPKITFTASDTGSSASETFTITPLYSSDGGTTYTASSISATDGATTTVKATATDNVGNEAEFIVTFKADGFKPVITVNSFTHTYTDPSTGDPVTDNILDTDTNIHIVKGAGWAEGKTWRDTSGGTVYFNSNNLTPVVGFGVTDTGSSATDITVSPDVSSIATTGTTTITATATDHVGNSTDFIVTFVADGTGPVLASGKAGVTLSNGNDGGEPKVYKKTDSGTTTYYYNASKSGENYILSNLSFALTKTEIDGTDVIDFSDETSGIGGYVYTVTTDAGTSDETTSAEKAITLADDAFTLSLKDDLNTGKSQIVNVYAKDNVGNKSTAVSFNVVPDSGAPEIDEVTGTFCGTIFSYYKESGTAKTASISLYESSDLPAISVKDDDGSGVAAYKLVYGATEGSEPTNTGAETDWISYTGGTISLPNDITTAEGNNFYLWLKDNTGNVAARLVQNSGSAIGMYAPLTGDLNYTFAATSENQTLVIKDYPASAGVKSITIYDDSIDSSFDFSNPSLSTTYTTASSIELNYRIFRTPSSKQLVITFKENWEDGCADFPALLGGDISFVVPANTFGTISGISITDVKDNTRYKKFAAFDLSAKDSDDNPIISNEFHELNDSDGTSVMALYEGEITLPESFFDSAVKYAVISEENPASMTWSDYDSSTGVNIPTTPGNTFWWLYVKDSSENIDVQKLSYKSLPITKYKTPTGFNYDYASDTITISNYDVSQSAGIKSITITTDEENTSDPANPKNMFDVDCSLKFDDFSATSYTSTYSNGLKLTLNENVLKSSVEILLYYPKPSTISSVSITDAAGYTITKTSDDDISITDSSGTDVTSTFIHASMAASQFNISRIASAVTKAITSTASNITHAVANFFTRNPVELPSNTDTLSGVSEITENPAAEKIEKLSQMETQPKKTKKQNKQNADVIVPEMQKILEDVIETAADEVLDNTVLDNYIIDYLSEETELSENLPEENISLAENNLIEYNDSEQVLVEIGSSKLVLAIVAIVVAFAASISLGVILLLKRRQIK